MTNTSHAEIARIEDRRDPVRQSRRADDCFPCGGSMVIAIGFSSLLSFIAGAVVGAMVW